MSAVLRDYRCKQCRKLLFRGFLVESVVEVKCRSCHALTTIESSQFNDYLCAVYPCPHRVTVVSPPKE